MSASTGTHARDVAGYAAAVRRHLAGLTPEQVDDLTDGLEADLADALADRAAGAGDAASHDLVAQFGDPAAYAAELRSSAGIPEPGVQRGGVRDALGRPGRALRVQGDTALAALRLQPWWGPVEELARSLEPLAWFVRAWLLYQVCRAFLVGAPEWVPRSFGGWVALAALTVVSAQWGRGRWQPGVVGRRVRTAATVVAVVAALPVLSTVTESAQRVEYVYETQTVAGPAVPQDGVVVDGMAVSNLFVYDAEGNPLQDVQVYDDRGRAVRTTFDEGEDDWQLPGVRAAWSFVPVSDVDGRQRWNVYPLQGAPSAEFEWQVEGGRLLTGEARTPPPPFAKAPPLVLPRAAASGAPVSPDASPTPTAGSVPATGPTTQAEPGLQETPGPVPPAQP